MLLASVWLTTTLAVFLAIGWFTLLAEPVRAAFTEFLHGRFEPLAVALSITGAAAITLGIRRLTQMNEDMPWYQGWAAGWSEKYATSSQPPRAKDRRNSD